MEREILNRLSLGAFKGNIEKTQGGKKRVIPQKHPSGDHGTYSQKKGFRGKKNRELPGHVRLMRKKAAAAEVQIKKKNPPWTALPRVEEEKKGNF